MSNILKPIVLRLNSSWSAIGFCSPKQAIITMCDDSDESGVLAMNIEYPKNELTGEYDFNSPEQMFPVKWEDWVNLPIREYDMTIATSKRLIRLPSVIIARNFHKMPMARKSPTKGSIFERDNGICQYTGKKLTRHQASIDHCTPLSRWKEIKGEAQGVNDWQNLVLCDKEINFKKGNSLNEEIGLKLIREPKAPAPMPVSAYITEAKHRDWQLFLHK